MRDIEEATVHLTVPNDHKYLGLVRLVVASAAADLDFPYDTVEDLRIVADELIHLVMTVAAPGGSVRIGVFPETEHFVFRGSALLPAAEDQAETVTKLDVLAGQIVASLVDNFQIENAHGRIEVAFSLRCPTGPHDG